MANQNTYSTSTSDWTTWRKFLRNLCATNDFRLTTDLGEWTIKENQFLSTLDWFFDQANHRLLHHSGAQWYKHKVSRQGRRQLFSTREERIPTDITDMIEVIRVTISQEWQGIFIKHKGTHRILLDEDNIDMEETKQSIVDF